MLTFYLPNGMGREHYSLPPPDTTKSSTTSCSHFQRASINSNKLGRHSLYTSNKCLLNQFLTSEFIVACFLHTQWSRRRKPQSLTHFLLPFPMRYSSVGGGTLPQAIEDVNFFIFLGPLALFLKPL